jgi:hypothetical protein
MRTETTTRPLRDLVRGFHSGAILLPQFQRDFVWKSAKIRNLLDSLLKGFPIGGFYLWRPASGTRDAKPKAHGEQRITTEFVGYLIDLVAKAELPTVESTPEAKRLDRLRAVFETIYDTNHPLRGALHMLRSLETVRIIEGEP